MPFDLLFTLLDILLLPPPLLPRASDRLGSSYGLLQLGLVSSLLSFLLYRHLDALLLSIHHIFIPCRRLLTTIQLSPAIAHPRRNRRHYCLQKLLVCPSCFFDRGCWNTSTFYYVTFSSAIQLKKPIDNHTNDWSNCNERGW